MNKINRAFLLCVFFIALASLTISKAEAQTAAAGSTLNFDGTNDFVRVTNNVIPTNGNFTIECWVNAPTPPVGNYREILSQAIQASPTRFYLGMDPAGQIRAGDAWITTGVTLPLNAWHHLALVRTNANTLLYLDGALQASHGSAIPNPTQAPWMDIGQQFGDDQEFWRGNIDELRIWNTARSLPQIATNRAHRLTGNEPGLVGYYKFDEGSGTNTLDSAPTNGFANGVLFNGPTWIASTAPLTEVLNTNDSGPGSLRQAVLNAAANPGVDTITFDPALSGKTIGITSGAITLNTDINLDASSLPGGITIDGNANWQVLVVANGVTCSLTALTVADGISFSTGGGILNSGTLTVNRCTITANTAAGSGGGGGIQNDGSLVLNESTVAGNNVSDGFGGGINGFGTLRVNQSTISGNHANAGGSGIACGGTLIVSNSIIAGNNGPLELFTSGPVTLLGNNLTNGNPGLAGLGNFGGPTQTMPPLPGSVVVDKCTNGSGFAFDQRGLPRVVGNYPDIGAVEANFTNVVTTSFDNGPGSLRQMILDSPPGFTIVFSNNLSGGTIALSSGQILLNKNLTIDGPKLTNGVSLSGSLNSRIFFVDGDTTTITLNSLTITNGSFNGGGAGIFVNKGVLTMNNCTVAGNQAIYGGGIDSFGTVYLNDCTLSGNMASGQGGGGILNNGQLYINNCTVVGNSAALGGSGIYNSGFLFLTNSIVCGNLGPAPDLLGSFSGIGNLTNGNPLLAPLSYYGGPTPTMPPVGSSPAIDAAIGSTFTNDQRGAMVPRGLAADIGAVEADIVTTTANSGAGSLRAAISNAIPRDLITFATNLSGGTILLTNGQLMVDRSVTIDASRLPVGIQISGNTNSRVFLVTNGVVAVFNSLTIANGLAPIGVFAVEGGGGGILCRGRLDLLNCTVVSNTVAASPSGEASFAGGFGCDHGDMRLTNCTVAFNKVLSGPSLSQAGAFYNFGGNVVLYQCTVVSNQASSVSGGFTVGYPTSLRGTLFANGNADLLGSVGAVTSLGNNLLVDGSGSGLVDGVNGDHVGTAASPLNPRLMPLGNYGGPTPTMPPLPDSPAIDAATVSTLLTDQRGGRRLVGSATDIGAVELNLVTSFGDIGPGSVREAIANAIPGDLIPFATNLSGVTISLFSSELFLNQSVTIDASALAGGIIIDGALISRAFEIAPGKTVTLNSLNIQNGRAGGGNYPNNSGGGILNRGTLTLTNCTMLSNDAIATPDSGGGAIENFHGNLTVSSSTLCFNGASLVGGGIENYQGSVTLNQSTISGNQANYPFPGGGGSMGGGLYNDSGSLAVNQSTISGNYGDIAGGIFSENSLSLFNSIVAGNSAVDTPEIIGTFTATGTNLTLGDPMLTPLGFFGGPTPTMPPRPGSPAMNTAAPTPFNLDQRGQPRVFGLAPDIGAVEAAITPALLSWKAGRRPGNGLMQLTFSNLSGATFYVLASTNATAPLNTWTNIGTAYETLYGTGQYEFTDPRSDNLSQRFYRIYAP